MGTAVADLRKKASKAMWLGGKYLLQKSRRLDARPAPLFIVGCQRSGTNMLLDVLGRSLETWIYSANNPRAFDNRRIKPAAELRPLLQTARCRWLVFKPLSDSQNIDRLLVDHPDGKAIWIFRQYQDVANSAVRSWDKWQLAHIRRVATQADWHHWMVDRMRRERRQLVKRHYHDAMSLHSASALKWYLRNQIYFDYGLDEQPGRVLLVKYEHLVRNPVRAFNALFNFLELRFAPTLVSKVYHTSINKEPFPSIDQGVARLCDTLMMKLDHTFQQQCPQTTDAPHVTR